MLLSYDDFRGFFEARGVAEAEGLAWLEIMEIMLDPFAIDGLEGKSLGTDTDYDSVSYPHGVNLDQSTKLSFNKAADDGEAGKKET